jgi:hypothetical protein
VESTAKFFKANIGTRVLLVLTLASIPRSINSALIHCDACRSAMTSSKDPSWPKDETATKKPSVLTACADLVLQTPVLLETGSVLLPASEVGVPLRNRLRTSRDAYTQRGLRALDNQLLLLNR